MATGPEHYQEAERLIENAVDLDGEGADMSLHVAVAQVHATLAHAAATALNDSEAGMQGPEWSAWLDAAGEPRTAKPDQVPQ